MEKIEETTTEIAVKQESTNQLAAINLSGTSVPDLDNAQEFPVDLVDSYWEPAEGECKRVYFIEFKMRQGSPTFAKAGSDNQIECVMLLEKTKGVSTVWANGSKILVETLKRDVEAGLIRKGTPLKVTALAKTKNKTNGFMSMRWSVIPLMIQA